MRFNGINSQDLQFSNFQFFNIQFHFVLTARKPELAYRSAYGYAARLRSETGTLEGEYIQQAPRTDEP